VQLYLKYKPQKVLVPFSRTTTSK